MFIDVLIACAIAVAVVKLISKVVSKKFSPIASGVISFVSFVLGCSFFVLFLETFGRLPDGTYHVPGNIAVQLAMSVGAVAALTAWSEFKKE